MLFYQVGELFQSYAVSRSRQSISDMMDICPEYANIEQDGQLVQVDPDEINIGDIIVIKAGERIPLDGVVISGSSFIDTSALTGESVPREVGEGSDIISGCVNGSGLLRRVMKEFKDSTVAKILELVENASSKKAKVENFITKFTNTIHHQSGCTVLQSYHPFLLENLFQNGLPVHVFFWLFPARVLLLFLCHSDFLEESGLHPDKGY